jgi:hypothetical protein
MSSIGIVLVLEEARPVCELMISDGGVPKPRAGGEPDFAPSPETPVGFPETCTPFEDDDEDDYDQLMR